MIIFESTLTTFEASFIFWGSWGSIKNWLELKIKPPLADPWNTLYNEKKDWKYIFSCKSGKEDGMAESLIKCVYAPATKKFPFERC